jgi:hypothetical protein
MKHNTVWVPKVSKRGLQMSLHNNNEIYTNMTPASYLEIGTYASYILQALQVGRSRGLIADSVIEIFSLT